MRNFVRASVLLLALVLSEPVLAGPLEDANAAYGKEDYATALRLFRPLADQGGASAQFMLGFMYDNGEGVPKDYVQAAKWWRLAADQGDARAQFNLGLMYDVGQGVPKDYVQAVKWYRLAADRGYARAQFNLGFSYSKVRKATRVCQKMAEIRRFNDFRPPFYLAFPEPDFGVPIRRYAGAS